MDYVVFQNAIYYGQTVRDQVCEDGLVFKAYRLVCHSTLGLRVQEKGRSCPEAGLTLCCLARPTPRVRGLSGYGSSVGMAWADTDNPAY